MSTASGKTSLATGCPLLRKAPIWERLNSAASKHSQNLAVVSVHQQPDLYGLWECEREDTCLRWSYATLQLVVDRLACSLQNLGLQSGDTLVTYLLNGVEFVLSFWVAHKLGCTFVPLSPQSLQNAAEAAYVVKLVQPRVVLTDATSAAHVDGVLTQSQVDVGTKIVAGASEDVKTGWITLASLLSSHVVLSGFVAEGPSRERTENVAILFTSGTTALPKAAPHTDETINAFCENLCLGGTSDENILCSVLPNNHAIGYFFPLHFMMHGGRIVFSSPMFDPGRLVSVLETEKVTHTALVPATLSIISESYKCKASSLKDVCIAGSSITPEDLRFVVDGLRSAAVSTGFGMTEGSPIWSAPKRPIDFICGKSTYSGSIAPGAAVKICSPGSQEPLPLGQPGELHQSGPGVVRGYLGCSERANEAFYTDEKGTKWFASGDEVVMHENGLFSVTGRYKDIINRGGMKISPAAMEATIRRLCCEYVQVIGVPETFGGEVPVVICRNSVQSTKIDLRDAIINEMGPKYAPIDIVKLRDLGLQDFPRSTAGKVQKTKLTSFYLKKKGASKTSQVEISGMATADASFYLDSLLQAYSKATGIAVRDLDQDRPIPLFSDSIGTMRVRDCIRKTLGIDFSAQDMTKHHTIRSQVALIQARAVNGKTLADTTMTETSSLLGADLFDIWPSLEKCSLMERLVTDTVVAQGFQYPGDVLAVIPVSDYMQVLVETKIIDSWNFAIAIETNALSTEDLRNALCLALTNNPILTSVYAGNMSGDGAYVTIHPSQKLWEQCIFTMPALVGTSDLQQLAMDYPYKQRSCIPGPLFHAALAYIEEKGCASMVLYVHHMVHDASSMRNFLSDLDYALAHPKDRLRRHTEFKAWADTFQALRFSPLANFAVEYHVARLQELHTHTRGLYPPAPKPRRAIEESPDGLDYEFDAPGLTTLKKRLRGLAASTVLKAAMALVNVSRTKHTHALFQNFEAGRREFAFAPSSLQAISPSLREASDVNGPTMQGVCNLIEVKVDERALDFLDRLQKEQLNLTKYCHAPLQRILKRLEDEGNRCHEVMIETHRTQFLTWAPGLLGEYDGLKVLQIAIRCVAGLVLVGGIGGAHGTRYMFSLRWDIANFSEEEARRYIKDVKKVIVLLTSEQGWDDNIGTLLAKLKE